MSANYSVSISKPRTENRPAVGVSEAWGEFVGFVRVQIMRRGLLGRTDPKHSDSMNRKRWAGERDLPEHCLGRGFQMLGRWDAANALARLAKPLGFRLSPVPTDEPKKSAPAEYAEASGAACAALAAAYEAARDGVITPEEQDALRPLIADAQRELNDLV